MPQPKLAPEGLESMSSLSIPSSPRFGLNLDDEIIIRITGESTIS